MIIALQASAPTASSTLPTAPATAPPSDDALRDIAENTIRGQLIDPDSAHFEWAPQPWVELTEIKMGLFARPIKGPMLLKCGLVNSKNRMGGYAGYAAFDVAIKDGVTVAEALDQNTDDLHIAADFCRKMGFDLSAAAPVAKITPPQDPSVGAPPSGHRRFGASFITLPPAMATAMQRPDLKGVFVARVDTDTPADASGLKPGDTITSFDDHSISSEVELQAAVSAASGGRPLKIEVIRAGQPLELQAILK